MGTQFLLTRLHEIKKKKKSWTPNSVTLDLDFTQPLWLTNQRTSFPKCCHVNVKHLWVPWRTRVSRHPFAAGVSFPWKPERRTVNKLHGLMKVLSDSEQLWVTWPRRVSDEMQTAKWKRVGESLNWSDTTENKSRQARKHTRWPVKG